MAAKKLRDKIFELSHSLVAPPIAPQFDSLPLDADKQVLRVWIAASSEMHSFRNAVFVRLGDKVTKASVPQIAELAQRKAHLNWLEQPCPGATRDDIDLFALEEISKGLKPAGGPIEFLQPDVRMFGSVPPLCSRIAGPSGDMVVPNRFAMLLIGKEPQHFLPGAFVSFARFRGVTRADAVFSSRELFGPIPKLIDKVMDVFESEASVITDKTQDFLSGAQNRKRYSLQALRELLVNALAHRDYQDPSPTQIYVFQDRIEFESPGGSLESIEAAKHGRSRWRNRSLARYMTELGLAQEKGTGLPTAIELTVAVAGVEPVFESDSWFKVTVPAYHPPSSILAEETVSPQAGALLISIGRGTIDPSLVRRSHAAFMQMTDDSILSYHYSGAVHGERWQELIREFRSWLMDCIENPRFQELHLFYRGPVAFGPVIGALAVRRKPLIVYSYDEETSLYQFAYRVDRRLLQEP